MAALAKTESKMREALRRLGLEGYEVVWSPDPSAERRGYVKGRTIVIFDTDEEGAWDTFLHEVVELKLRPVLGVYREIINGLIGALESIAYREKERAIEDVVRAVKEVAGR